MIGGEHPPHMRVPESDEYTTDSAAEVVGRVGIMLYVAVLMMSSMNGHPFQDRPLDGHAAEDTEHEFDRSACIE